MDVGRVMKKLCMQFGNLFTCVVLMMQVKFENQFQISFLGYCFYQFWTFSTYCRNTFSHFQKFSSFIVAVLLQVGTGDPYSVVFHLHDTTSQFSLGKSIDTNSAIEISSDMDACLSEEHLVVLMKILMKYVMDDSVKIVDMASQTLRVSLPNGNSLVISQQSYFTILYPSYYMI